MSSNPFQSDEFRAIQREHLFRTITFLLEQGLEFAVAAEVQYMSFDPEIPSEIRERFAPISLFVLSNYTFESATVDEEALYFEAGFGEQDFGSHVTLPLLAIRQIVVGEYPVAVNIAEPLPSPAPERSMEALLSNPENLKLLKKKRK